MKKWAVYCLLSAVVLSSNAGDASVEIRKKQAACGELSSYTRLAGCFQGVLEESDALLNKEYAELINYLTGTNRKNLIDAQRKWVKFREADCLFSEPRKTDDDYLASASRAICLAERTIERLEHLEKYNAPWSKGCNGCPW